MHSRKMQGNNKKLWDVSRRSRDGDLSQGSGQGLIIFWSMDFFIFFPVLNVYRVEPLTEAEPWPLAPVSNVRITLRDLDRSLLYHKAEERKGAGGAKAERPRGGINLQTSPHLLNEVHTSDVQKFFAAEHGYSILFTQLTDLTRRRSVLKRNEHERLWIMNHKPS